MSNHMPKASNRFRILRGNWMPQTEASLSDVLEDFESPADREARLFDTENTGLAPFNYPSPASLVDVPPLVSCFAVFKQPKRRYTRQQALRIISNLNSRQVGRDVSEPTMLWHIIVENLGFESGETVVIIDASDCCEDRFRRYTLRIVQPTAWEVAKYGRTSEAVSFTRRTMR